MGPSTAQTGQTTVVGCVPLKEKSFPNVEKRNALIIRLQRRELLEADYSLLVNLLKDEVHLLEPSRGKKPGKNNQAGGFLPEPFRELLGAG